MFESRVFSTSFATLRFLSCLDKSHKLGVESIILLEGFPCTQLEEGDSG